MSEHIHIRKALAACHDRLSRALGKTALWRIGRAFHVKSHRIFGNLLLDGFHHIHKTAVISLVVSMIFGGRGRPFPVSRSLPSNPVAHSRIGILPQHAAGYQKTERTASALPRAYFRSMAGMVVVTHRTGSVYCHTHARPRSALLCL